jgi:SET domain-containing protein
MSTRVYVLPTHVRAKHKVRLLPKLYISHSNIAAAGNGVFASEPIPEGGYITEYSGVIISRKQALLLRGTGDDTHCMGIDLRGTRTFDGRETAAWPLSRYVGHHAVGSFVNDPYGSEYTVNARVVKAEQPNGHVAPSGDYLDKRVFYVAKRRIEENEEIFIDYGPMFRSVHFR